MRTRKKNENVRKKSTIISIKTCRSKPNMSPNTNPDITCLKRATRIKNPSSLIVECRMIIRYVLSPQIKLNENSAEQISHTADSSVKRKSFTDISLTNRMVPIEAATDITISTRNTIFVLRYFVRYVLRSEIIRFMGINYYYMISNSFGAM